MRWQCKFVNPNGARCENEAIYRLHFSNEHPFDHADVCQKHFEEYKFFCWVQDINDKGELRWN